MQTNQNPQPASDSESKTLWMGAIQSNWDESFVESLFPNSGLLNVKLMRSPSSMPSGYAFLEFSSHEAAKIALDTYNGLQIQGTNVYYRLNWGAGGRKQSSNLQEYSLFVGDLAPEVTDSVLHEAFVSRFTTCSSAKVVTDATTGSSKGYGFVRFTDKSQSDEALQVMNGTMIGSRAIRVSTATQRRQDRAIMHMHHAQHIPQVQYTLGGDLSARINGYRVTGHTAWTPSLPNPVRTSPSVSLTENQQFSQATSPQYQGTLSQTSIENIDSSASMLQVSPEGSTQLENTTVFVGNLEPSVTEEQLQQHFQGFGTIVQTKIPPNRGCGFVKFETREAAEKALQTMHGSILSGLRIRLDWGKANAARNHSHHDSSMIGYSALQAQQQFYMAQWQAQQAAYYYRYGSTQNPHMYLYPQQLQPPTTVRQTQTQGLIQSPQLLQTSPSTNRPEESGISDFSGIAANPPRNPAWNEVQ